MSDETYVVVLTMDLPSSYIFGMCDTPLEELEGDRIRLINPTRMKVVPPPENDKHTDPQRLWNPILTCDDMYVDLRHFLGVGYAKEVLEKEYRAWQKAYQNHDKWFSSDEDEEKDDTQDTDHPSR